MKTKVTFALVALIAGVLFTACGNNQKNARNNDEPGVTALDTVHNSRNSLDYAGTYTGTMPCADCEGIHTTLTLQPDGNYTMTSVYKGKGDESKNTFTESGVYTWDNTGSIITLNNDISQRYQVGENQLFALDMDGNRITGDLADMYILRKSEN